MSKPSKDFVLCCDLRRIRQTEVPRSRPEHFHDLHTCHISVCSEDSLPVHVFLEKERLQYAPNNCFRNFSVSTIREETRTPIQGPLKVAIGIRYPPSQSVWSGSHTKGNCKVLEKVHPVRIWNESRMSCNGRRQSQGVCDMKLDIKQQNLLCLISYRKRLVSPISSKVYGCTILYTVVAQS